MACQTLAVISSILAVLFESYQASCDRICEPNWYPIRKLFIWWPIVEVNGRGWVVALGFFVICFFLAGDEPYIILSLLVAIPPFLYVMYSRRVAIASLAESGYVFHESRGKFICSHLRHFRTQRENLISALMLFLETVLSGYVSEEFSWWAHTFVASVIGAFGVHEFCAFLIELILTSRSIASLIWELV